MSESRKRLSFAAGDSAPFHDPAETQRWARAFAARYTNITEANTIIEYQFQGISNSFSELMEPNRPISECLRLIPDARLDNATMDFARERLCPRHVAEDVLKFSGLISAAEKGKESFTLKVESILAKKPSISVWHSISSGPNGEMADIMSELLI